MTGATEPLRRDPPGAAARRWFLATLGAVLAYRMALAAAFPVLGDEAYLFTWAREPAWGYYDHPPLAAWLLRPLVAAGLGGSLFALRLPSVLLYPGLAVALVALVRRLAPEAGPERAYLAGTLFLLVPIHVLGVLMLTDVPLVLCSFLAAAALCLAERDEGRRGLGWYAAAGALLGLALLAKYFAALVAAAFLVWFLSAGWTRRRAAGFAVLVACALPFVLVHLGWNATHCWSTVAFNFHSRHAGEGKNYNIPRNLLVYAGTLVYLAGPPLLWALGRRWRGWAEALRSTRLGPAALAFLVPMSLLLASAAALLFGAYWMLPFVPFLFLLAPALLERRELLRSARFLAVWTGVQALALAVAVALPLSAWRGAAFYDSLVTMERTDQVLARLAEEWPELRRGEARIAAGGYTLASLLSFAAGERVVVFGEGSHYARQDDLWTDWRELAGRDLLLVGKRPVAPGDFDPYFEAVERRELEVAGVTLYTALGRSLDYGRYRREVLVPVGERYYRRSGWLGGRLPTWGCPFCERHFGATACP